MRPNALTRLLPGVWAVALLVTAGSVAHAAPPLEVYTVNYPLAYFAERIGGSVVKVTFPAPPDVDPAFWSPPVATVQRYQRADLVLLNGAGYAGWVNRVSLPRKSLVDTSRSFRDRTIQVEDLVTHGHGLSGEHSHGGTAFVTWLDFGQATEQARAIKDALVRTRPASRAGFEANFAQLAQDLESLDKRLRAAFAPLAGQPLLASHPVYQYMARRYALDLKSVIWEPDEVPSAGEWRKLRDWVSSHPAKWMLWEGAPRVETVSRLQEMGIESIVFDPCSKAPMSSDFSSAMRSNIANVEAAATR